MTGWLLVAASVAFAAMSIALKVQTSRLSAAKADLQACETRYGEALASIDRQNKAVESLAKAAAERQKQAKAALAAAGKGNVGKDAEIARLRGLNAKSCAAAVEGVKQGLRP